MISTIVLEPRSFPRGEAGRALVVRSLGWLIGAAVAGVVGEVVLAADADLALGAVADAVGSRLVEGEDAGSRLRAAAVIVRSDPVLVVLAGYAPDAAAVEEIARLRAPAARLLAKPDSFVQRLFPDTAAIVGVLAPRAALRGAADFTALARLGRAAPVLAARARRLT